MELGLRHFSDPLPAGGGDFSGHHILDADAGEVLIHVQPSVAVVIGRHLPDSPGTLFVSSKRVVWLSDVDAGKGYAVDFLSISISLHAVSRDPEAYPSLCIYTQKKKKKQMNGFLVHTRWAMIPWKQFQIDDERFEDADDVEQNTPHGHS